LNEQNKPKFYLNKDKLAIILCILFACAVLSMLFYMNSAITRMQENLDMLRQEVLQQSGSISSQVGNITANIDASMKKENSIISDYSYRILTEQIDREKNIVPVLLTVRPKEHQEGLLTTFIAETDQGKTISIQGEEGESYNYSAVMEVPLTVHNLKFSVSFNDGTLQKSEKLEEIYDIFNGCIMNVDSYASSLSVRPSDHKLTMSGTIETSIASSSDGKNYPVRGEILISRNGRTVKKLPIQIEDSMTEYEQDNSQSVAACLDGALITYYTEFNEAVDFNNNDTIELKVAVTDNLGFQYKKIIDSERIDEKGNVYPNNVSGEVVVE